MRRFRLLLASAFLLCAASNYPPTRTDNVSEVIHGVKITDPYRWLEEQNSPETRAWIDAESKYARQYLDALPGRAELQKKLEALLKIDTMTAPAVRKERYFFTRRRASEVRSSIYMRAGYTGKDTLLLDPGAVSKDTTTSVQLVTVSQDGTLLVYGVRQGGEDETEIRLMNVDTRRALPDTLPRGRYFGFAIKGDNSGCYYARFTPQGTHVYFHAMGTPPSQDKEIFGKGYGPKQLIGVALSQDSRYLMLTVSEGVPPTHMEIYAQDLANGGPLRTVVKDVEAEFKPRIIGHWMYLGTNWKAPNWRILRADLNDPAREKWREVIPEGKLPIDGMSFAGGRLFVTYLEDVVTRIRQFDLDGKDLGAMKLTGIGTVSSPSASRWESDEAFYSYTSLAEPGTIYRYHVSTGSQEVWFRPEIPLKAGDIEVKQVWFESNDDTRVPMFVAHRKGLVLDGRRPTLLTGYGGFSISETPGFTPRAAAWMESGGVFALPNLRGGGEFGERWHRAGMFEKKQNVFDDFIAAAEWLIRNKYTRPDKLGIYGNSNGGLLMGAMMTQRPDLFGAIVCGAPLLDMLRFQKMKVGAWWTTEYGSADDPKQFAYLFQYSPYHNVKKGIKCPAMMFVSGDSDTRVDPSHARKMTALMQASNASDKPILLRYDTKSGHSSSGSVDKIVEQMTDELSFLLAELR